MMLQWIGFGIWNVCIPLHKVSSSGSVSITNGKSYPGIPFDLLMVMFTSWGKTTYSIKDSINDFYRLIEEYLFIANDHYPENNIPGQ